MSQKVALYHKTEYQYSRPISLGPQVVRLRPAAHCRTPIEAYSLRISPEKHFLNWQQDVAGNYLARLVFPEPADHFVIEVDLVSELVSSNPLDFFIEPGFERFPFVYPSTIQGELTPYRRTLPFGDDDAIFVRWIEELRSGLREPRPSVAFLAELNRMLRDRIDYLIRMEPGVQTPVDTLRKGSGSCRDSAWLLVQTLRHIGLAARFVSGYLIQLRPDEPPLEGPPGPAADFADLHAWCEVYLPGAGWIGLDATSGLFASEGHIPLACTADPTNAAPLSGAHEPAEARFDYEMNVARLPETGGETIESVLFDELDRLGERIDADLKSRGVRLTMGGEPTFVDARSPDAPEWNVAALGGEKRAIGSRLLYRLAEKIAPGGLLFHGQGKWYPGEELPRWALGLYYRADGAPIWERGDLLAREGGESPAAGIDAARDLMAAVAGRLGVDERYIRAARDPIAGESYSNRLSGVPPVRGFVLPLRWWHDGAVWTSSRWASLGEPIALLPGDSPMGYRLPLERLDQERFIGGSFAPEYSRFDGGPELPAPEDFRARPMSVFDFEQLAGANADPAGDMWLRTALCVELREGAIHVFLPPQSTLEVFLSLVGAIEVAAATRGVPIFFEGYPPPTDTRLRALLVTPDPGVIEVNVPPAASWAEARDFTRLLYETAREEMLVSEKFELDGRPTGSGGGNHITLGGPIPAESPFLRRPGLLRGLVTYFQHHPALSYLFSGLFIGPTSQAPRIDEARLESLYELEIAFDSLPADGSLPWLCDRLLRHHLTDLTGNTHRAEICIDKFYPPDSLALRLGLVELRAFEMLPRPEMNLLALALVRAIVARLVVEDYHRPLLRFGNSLHDLYMLPYYLEADLASVLDDLRRFGYGISRELFAPILDFRFPLAGRTRVEDCELEIRAALEPWNVLGEERLQGATARMVDSAVERVEVRVRRFDPSTRVLLCNGFRVPLMATDRPGEAVAGIRFKAWHLSHTLHPNLRVHAPLTFDLVDPVAGRSLGGCTYHVAHPGGRAFDRRPVNAAEAEARRHARFWAHGHSPGTLHVPPGREDREYPGTLDLRRLDP